MGAHPRLEALTTERPSGTSARAFEALFHRGLAGDPALAALLRANGYDPANPLPEYPSSVWAACVEAARTSRFAALSEAAGRRALGALFADGFRSTAVGCVFEGLHYTGEAYLIRLPGILKLARPDLESELCFEGERRCRLKVRGPFPSPHFMAGLAHARLHERGLPVQVEVAQSAPDGYELLVTW
jgi:uncharacterized protein (TIGR02265 family)